MFVFKLESFLKYWTLQEQTLKAKSRETMIELRANQDRRAALSSEMQRQLLVFEEQASQRVNCILKEMEKLEGAAVEIQDRLEQFQVQLARAAFRKKALEELRSKKEKEFKRLETKKEQKEIDELFSRRFV